MMNKRGQGGLSMNTIVVAIIAIIILLLLVTFFTGGLSTIGQRITEVFKTGTSGYDLDLAVKNCKDYCARAQNLPADQQPNSAYCKQSLNVKDPDNPNGPATPRFCADLLGGCTDVSCSVAPAGG